MEELLWCNFSPCGIESNKWASELLQNTESPQLRDEQESLRQMTVIELKMLL